MVDNYVIISLLNILDIPAAEFRRERWEWNGLNGKEKDEERKKLPRSFIVIASVLIALIVLLAVLPFSKSVVVESAPADVYMCVISDIVE